MASASISRRARRLLTASQAPRIASRQTPKKTPAVPLPLAFGCAATLAAMARMKTAVHGTAQIRPRGRCLTMTVPDPDLNCMRELYGERGLPGEPERSEHAAASGETQY